MTAWREYRRAVPGPLLTGFPYRGAVIKATDTRMNVVTTWTSAYTQAADANGYAYALFGEIEPERASLDGLLKVKWHFMFFRHEEQDEVA
jgi:hypothetical protein